jgi:hypothetical protein
VAAVAVVCVGVALARPLMYAPVSSWVSNSSRLIVPPVTPMPTNVFAFAGTTAYAYGDYITNSSGWHYWCVVAGTSGGTGPTHQGGDAANGTATFRWMNKMRNQLILVNDSANVVYLGFGWPASTNVGRAGGNGIRLNANGGTYNSALEQGNCPQGAVYGISATAASNNVGVQEF